MNPKYEELISRIYAAPGRESVALLEELVRLADADNDIDMAYGARFELSEVASNQGFPEKAIVAFAWCLAQFDKDPERDDWFRLLWRYKVMLELIPVFARVSREKIVEMQEDMARRLQELGETERTAHYYRSWNFMRMGDYDTALKFQETYISMPRSQVSDCLACERDRQIELLCRMQRYEDSLDLAEPVIDGTMSCGEVPQFTNAHIVRSLMRLGRIDDARRRHKSGYRSVRRERKYLGTIGDLMLLPIHLRDFDEAIPMMVRHAAWAQETAADELKFRFYSSCALLLEALSQVHPESRKLRLPRGLPCCREDDLYDPKQLAQWFAKETRQLADQFNQRNGNKRYDEILAENRELVNLP